MKNTLFVQTTASPITTKGRVFYPLVNILLYYLETLKSYERNWIRFASPINTWIVCIHYSIIDSVEKFLLQRVDKGLITCSEQLTLITGTNKEKTLAEKVQNCLIISFPKTKTSQTSGLVSAERIEQVKKTKFELELKRIVDCFLAGHGKYDSNLVSFKIKSF